MEQLRLSLVELINKNELPFEARYYVVKDVFRDLTELYSQYLLQAAAEHQKAENKVEKVEAEEVE